VRGRGVWERETRVAVVSGELGLMQCSVIYIDLTVPAATPPLDPALRPEETFRGRFANFPKKLAPFQHTVAVANPGCELIMIMI
jgi:hypothetical protein